MITKPTTFVVGAGASCVYGLPTGAGLLQSAKKLQPKDDTYQLIGDGQNINKLNAIIVDLKEHGAESIDTYLQTRRKDVDTQKIGKRMIAVLLAEALTNLNQPPPDEDWLKYIFNRMFDGAGDDFEQFQQNKVTFVTFNFDTCIENRFNSILSNTFGSQATGFPPVIHVHGSLSVPESLPKTTPGMPTVGFPPRDHFNSFSVELTDWASNAASDIRVIFEEIDAGVLETARAAIKASSVVWFLGFGYGTANLKRLGIPETLSRPSGPALVLLGSAFDLQDGEQASVENQIQMNEARIRLASPGLSCRNALRKLGGL